MKNGISLVLILLLVSCFSSCSDDDSGKNNTDFEVPELTLSNTIQFTVDASVKGYANVIVHGGKIAIDWGDGNTTKDIHPESEEPSRSEFSHRYATGGKYRIKIWADEITYINISSLLNAYEQLHVGTCPVLKDAMFNSFPKDKTLDLNGCKNMETLNLGNWQELESVTLNECISLENIMVYTNPKLIKLDLSKNTRLTDFESSDLGTEELILPSSIVNVTSYRGKLKTIRLENYKNLTSFKCYDHEELTSLNLSGCDNLRTIAFTNTQVETFDFSEFPDLAAIECSNTRLSSLDITKNEELRTLICANIGLTSLDITHNPSLTKVDCSDNFLTTLDVSQNSRFQNLYINGNQFEKEELETIFQTLPDLKAIIGRATGPAPQPCSIKIYNNPGTVECDTKIITDKGWVIKTE